MIHSIFLACCLLGEPQPQMTLILSGHSGDWQFKRLITDVRHDEWINCRFRVWQVERDITSPQWSTSRSAWSKFPKPSDQPHGMFCTRGVATAYLRKELARHMDEMKDEYAIAPDAWMETQQLNSRYHDPFRDEEDRFKAPAPAEAPLDGG